MTLLRHLKAENRWIPRPVVHSRSLPPPRTSLLESLPPPAHSSSRFFLSNKVRVSKSLELL
ncbi:hypothetical protein MTR_6g055395 [Medicago truncatula]|uniref:Uncharacterized protein n=1 Tax=Medicago truncatula TaxID=3880 RepID=A0A072U9W5_MEDTR|nr:hypothetical protein MTR_6g055395 [Medicago truncatula]